MALALNVFQTIPAVVSTSPTIVYTAPVGYSGVVLLAQVANVSNLTHTITFIHRRGAVDTEILKDFPVSGNDSANLVSGKLILETGDRLVLSGSSSSDLKFIASILETLN